MVLADFLFTATAGIAQPLTGYLLIRQSTIALSEGWVLVSLILYGVAGLSWLPVVWMQMRMRDLAHAAAVDNTPLPPAYYRLFHIWFVLGWPAFIELMGTLVR